MTYGVTEYRGKGEGVQNGNSKHQIKGTKASSEEGTSSWRGDLPEPPTCGARGEGYVLQVIRRDPDASWHSLGIAGSVLYPQGKPSTHPLIALMKIVMSLFPVRAAPSRSFPNTEHSNPTLWMIPPSARGCPESAFLYSCDSCSSSQQSQRLGNEVRTLAVFQRFRMAAWPQIAVPTWARRPLLSEEDLCAWVRHVLLSSSIWCQPQKSSRLRSYYAPFLRRLPPTCFPLAADLHPPPPRPLLLSSAYWLCVCVPFPAVWSTAGHSHPDYPVSPALFSNLPPLSST